MSNYHKKNQQTVPEVIILGLFKAIGALFRLLFKGISQKKGLTLSQKQEIIAKRQEVESMLRSDNIHELRQAVFEADKLVDRVLKAYGYAGESMGERLKNAREYVDGGVYEGIWQGHKVRNQLAHEHELKLSDNELKSAAQKLLRYVKSI